MGRAEDCPRVGEKFRVVAPGGVVVREKALPTSAHAGDLRKGETVKVLEAKVSEEVPGYPVVRIRIDVRVPLRAPVAGWVPLTEAGGKTILQKVEAPGASSSSSSGVRGDSGTSSAQGPTSVQSVPDIPSVGEVFRVVAPSGAAVRKGVLATSSQCGRCVCHQSVSSVMWLW